MTQTGRERDSGDAIQHPEWTFRACGDVAIPLWGADEFLVGGQSLTPLARPRPRDHQPGEGRTLSSEDFERPCRPVAACAPLANGFHTRNHRLERRASRSRGLSESDANNGLAWHSPLHSNEARHRAANDPMLKSVPRHGAGHPPVPDIRRLFGGSDASQVDTPVRGNVLDLAARNADIH